MSDVHAELLAVTTLMEQHYAVFAQARTVAAALKTAADEEAAVKAAVTAQQEALATLRQTTKKLETRRKKAARLVAELEATAQSALDDRKDALAAVLQAHLPYVEEAAAARTFAQQMAQAVYDEALVQNENRIQAYRRTERELDNRVQHLRSELQAMVDRAIGETAPSAQ